MIDDNDEIERWISDTEWPLSTVEGLIHPEPCVRKAAMAAHKKGIKRIFVADCWKFYW
tara:strand:- start:2945 stop:3118 length:174 start_codon:yes stop_codon:yes gene_type:complete